MPDLKCPRSIFIEKRFIKKMVCIKLRAIFKIFKLRGESLAWFQLIFIRFVLGAFGTFNLKNKRCAPFKI